MDCEWAHDFDSLVSVLHRKDTGEIIDRRKLTEEEMQLSLPGKKGRVTK